MKTQDPTKSEMISHLIKSFGKEYEDFDAEEAMYWFASNYHLGQGSNLYSALSTSPFRPGIIAKGVTKDSLAEEMYKELVIYFIAEQENGKWN